MLAADAQSIETVSRQTGLLCRILHRDADEENMPAFQRSPITQPERINLVRAVLRHFQRPVAAQFISGNSQRVAAAGVGGGSGIQCDFDRFERKVRLKTIDQGRARCFPGLCLE